MIIAFLEIIFFIYGKQVGYFILYISSLRKQSYSFDPCWEVYAWVACQKSFFNGSIEVKIASPYFYRCLDFKRPLYSETYKTWLWFSLRFHRGEYYQPRFAASKKVFNIIFRRKNEPNDDENEENVIKSLFQKKNQQ